MAYVSELKFGESAQVLTTEYPDEVGLRIRRVQEGREDGVIRFSRIGPWREFQWLSQLPEGPQHSRGTDLPPIPHSGLHKVNLCCPSP